MNTKSTTPEMFHRTNCPAAPVSRIARPGGATPVLPASLRVPATPENGALLRFLREAELEAWDSVPPFQAPATVAEPATLREHVSETVKENRQEGLFLAAVAAVGGGALTFALWDSVAVVQHWSSFVQFVQKLLL
jgi:hypothetical protein